MRFSRVFGGDVYATNVTDHFKANLGYVCQLSPCLLRKKQCSEDSVPPEASEVSGMICRNQLRDLVTNERWFDDVGICMKVSDDCNTKALHQ